MKIFAYMRFSSENQTGNTSIDVQRETITRFVQHTPELKGGEIVERIDEARSATTVRNRPALASIMSDASRGDIVVVYKLDRLGRNLLEALLVLKELDDRKVRVLSVTEPEQQLTRQIQLAVAEDFSRNLSERCRRALNSLATSGFVANKAPFGYKREGPRAHGKFVPIPEQAAIVKRIFTMRASSSSLREIVRTLNQENVLSPKGKEWVVSCVRNLLRNDAYIGTIKSGDRIYKKGHGLVGRRPRSEWSVCENAHEPIVERSVWDSVRKLDSEKSVGHVKTTLTRAEYPWTGFLKCSECGANLVRHSLKGKVFYGCQSGRNRGVKLPCNHQCLLHADSITERILGELMEHAFGEDLNDLIAEMKKAHQRSRGSSGQRLYELQRRLEQKDRDIATAQRRLARVSDDTFEILLKEIERMKLEREEINMQIGDVQKAPGNSIVNFADMERRVRENVKLIPGLVRDSNTIKARKALSSLIEKVDVTPDKKARMHMAPGFLVALGCESEHIPSGI